MKFPYRILAFTIAATAAAACLDQAAFDGLFVPKTADHPAGIYGYDWAMGLKQLGTLYPSYEAEFVKRGESVRRQNR